MDDRQAQGMGYEDAVRSYVTAKQARAEIARHDACGDCAEHGNDGHATAWGAFVCEHGERETYRGADVLDWLGY